MTNIEYYCPKNKQEWRAWLEINHIKQQAVWLIFYKKKSPNYNLSWSESVDEALCFGWIDSVKKTIDSEKYIQYFSKRKAKSNWSKVNKDKIESLGKQGLIKKAGYESVEIAKKNDSWTYLDDVEALITPEDLKKELETHDGALHYFDSLSKSIKKMLLYWVLSAKRKETREKRILDIAENAAKSMKPGPFR